MHRWEYDGAEGWEYITLPRTFPKKYDKRMVSEFLWEKEVVMWRMTMNKDDSDSKLSRIEEFVAKVGLFARQYPEFTHKVSSSGVPYSPFARVVNVTFITPNSKEQVMFCTMIDGVYNPYGEEEPDLELYKTLIDKLECEFVKMISHGGKDD